MSDADKTRRYRQRARVAWREIDGEAVLVDPVRGRMLVLNDTGLFLWQALESPHDLAQLSAALCEAFDVEGAQAGRDVAAFVGSLTERNLVETA